MIIQSDDGGLPFSKTLAVNSGFERSTGDIVAILDCDVWLEPQYTRAAVDLIANGAARWVRPANRVYRLTEEATATLIAQDPLTPFAPRQRADFESIRKVWGLLHIFPREAFEAIGGYDPRFRGWGGEDWAAIEAMDALWGRHTILPHPLYHLYHRRLTNQAGESVWIGQTDRNVELRQRYSAASGDPAAMRALIDEAMALRSEDQAG
jgi:glycosyltransferase involved in cell wall biosynthesis